MTWSHYLLQVNIYLVVFYAFYRLLLSQETYFMLNRLYLICSGIFSLAIPFMQIDWFSKQEISQQIYVQVGQINEMISTVVMPEVEQQWHWGTFIALLYVAGATFFLIRFAMQLLKVKKLFKGIKSGLAFSFWNKKVVSPHLPEAATVNHHEDIHIKQLHTADIIFFELIGIITWFNPIIYLYKETVKNIHEYLADEAAAKFQGDKEAYSMLLLNQAFGVNTNPLTNGFFKKSMIKKRIFMLYKERSRKTAILKYGIFVPLFAAALMLSSATIKKNNQLLAASEKIQIEEIKDVVAEVLEAPKEKKTKAKSVETKVKFITPKTTIETSTDTEPFYRFVGNNIKYPINALNSNVQGNLVAYFTVENKLLKNITIEPKLGYGADEEVSAVLTKYNQRGLADGKYSMKFEFRLSGSYTRVLNENATGTVKPGYNGLNPITIMGYAKVNEEDKIYSFVSLETPPTYPGGIAEFYKFLGATIKYPEEAAKQQIQGHVFVSFVVEKDGSISDIKVDRKLGFGTDEEAVRVLKLSRKWNPGLHLEKPVRVKYNLPIKFALNKATNSTLTLKPKKGLSLSLSGVEYDPEKAPLYVLDGKVLENDELKDIDPSDIESISVLKELSLVKKYGEKAKNGVIEITTTRGLKEVVVKQKEN